MLEIITTILTSAGLLIVATLPLAIIVVWQATAGRR